MEAFERFGLAHLLVIALTIAASLLAIRAERRASVRIALSLILAGTMLAFIIIEGARGHLTALDFLPFHLSDFAVLLAIFALLTVKQRAAELLYFLAYAEVLAIITPDVGRPLTHPYTIIFFVLHAGVVIAALLLTFGYGLIPEKGAVIRAMIFLNVYAAFAAVVNFFLGTNFLYLRQKPSQQSPLDWMGPWPWYLVTAELVAAALFTAAYLPFWWKRRRTSATAPL